MLLVCLALVVVLGVVFVSDVDVDVVAGAGFGGVAAGFGLVAGGPVDLAGVSGGPFITAIITDTDPTNPNDPADPAPGVVGVVAVVDSDTADGVVQALGVAAVGEIGGTVVPGEPVGSAGGLAGLFSMPTTAQTFTGPDGEVQVVYVTTTDRRTLNPEPHNKPHNEPAGGPPVGVTGVTGVGQAGVRSGGLDKLINVALEVSVELGRTRVTLSEVLDYDVGSIIELDRAAGAPVDIRVNDTLLAQGEVVLIDDEYAVRITAIIEPHQT